MAEAFPGSLYALSLDPKKQSSSPVNVRLVHVHSGGQKHVAIFIDEPLAKKWVKENMPSNTVVQPFALTSKDEVIGFLRDIAKSGDTHVCFDPIKHAGKLVEITKLIEQVEGFD